jgi:ferrous iron transport protein A
MLGTFLVNENNYHYYVGKDFSGIEPSMRTLDAVPVGHTVRMKAFHTQNQSLRYKLIVMGFTPGVPLTIIRVAPLGCPLQIQLRGYNLSLRKKECEYIEVDDDCVNR